MHAKLSCQSQTISTRIRNFWKSDMNCSERRDDSQGRRGGLKASSSAGPATGFQPAKGSQRIPQRNEAWGRAAYLRAGRAHAIQ
jgi:hypothetical protein